MPTRDAITPHSQTKFSFLASHGLRSPLSAIRWACGRLRKSTTGSLNPEQKELIEEIHANAKILTMVLASMQLLGKLDDRSYKIKHESLALCDFLMSLTHGMDHPRSARWSIDCSPDIGVETDGPILESILLNLITVCLEASKDDAQIAVAAERGEDGVRVTLTSELELPFVHSGENDRGGEVSHLVGGVPGLMLCLANGMARYLTGKVELRELAQDKRYAVTFSLPSRATQVA